MEVAAATLVFLQTQAGFGGHMPQLDATVGGADRVVGGHRYIAVPQLSAPPECV